MIVAKNRFSSISQNLCCLTLFTVMSIAPLQAAEESKLSEKIEFDYSMEVGAYFGYFNKNQFGTGEIVDFRTFEMGDKNTESFELYIKPGVTLNYNTDNLGTFYSGLVGVATLTRLDGDPGGNSQGDEEDVDFEEYYLGWRSENSLESGDSVYDLSLGGQQFEVGYDGFFISDAVFDQYGDGAYWLAPRRAFTNTMIFRYNHEKLASQIFYLKAGPQFQENTELVGVNADGKIMESFEAGVSYLEVIDSDEEFLARDGMQVVATRAKLTPLPNQLPAFTLKGEYIKEFGDNNGTDIDADGWYAEAMYSFPEVMWTPSFRYRYSSFSGDADIEGGDIETFDPLFYGFKTPGNWYQGEIAGSYLTYNANQNTHMFHIAAFPTETIGLDLIHFEIMLDENNYFGAPVSSDELARETDFYITFFPNDKIVWGITLAALTPQKAAEEAIGGDETWYSAQVFMNYYF